MSIFISCCILTAAYGLLMIVYRIGWSKQPVFVPEISFQPDKFISVIIPARNEAGNIQACIRSVRAQNYPAGLFEIIVVDDHSEDNTAVLAEAAGAQVISLKNVLQDGEAVHAYKKKALAAGIAASQGWLIITTDADCIAGPDWLKCVAALYQREDAAMIIGPVAFTPSSTLAGIFQDLDFTTMQGITVAVRRLRMGSMANGANLAFSREAFDTVQGYSGIDHLASGDDYLLLHKMQQQFSHSIHYLKSPEAIIRTAPQPDWGSFLQQRIRWASKSGKYPDHRLTAVLLLVYLFNVTILATAVAGFWLPDLWLLVAGMLATKTVAELVFLFPVAGFFGNRNRLWVFPLLEPVHILYIILAGFLGMLGSYRWKGRVVR